MSPSLIVTWIFIVELTTSFSAHGIYRLTPFGMKQIVWREIETLKVGIFFLDILTFKKIYRIPLLMYQDAHALVNHVQEKYLIDSNGIDKMM
jgi:hypothetical protein